MFFYIDGLRALRHRRYGGTSGTLGKNGRKSRHILLTGRKAVSIGIFSHDGRGDAEHLLKLFGKIIIIGNAALLCDGTNRKTGLFQKPASLLQPPFLDEIRRGCTEVLFEQGIQFCAGEIKFLTQHGDGEIA